MVPGLSITGKYKKGLKKVPFRKPSDIGKGATSKKLSCIAIARRINVTLHADAADDSDADEDYEAGAYGVAVGLDSIDGWTDTTGLYIREAKKLVAITLHELICMAEMSQFHI